MKKLSSNALVLILAIGVFGILNTEMGIVGVIPYVSQRFGVSIPDAGLLVSGFAFVVAIAGPTMPLLFSRVNRKRVMLLSLGVFSLCNMFSIFAPTFELLLAARIIPAAFHPLYVSMAMAIAQYTGDTPAARARSSARVFVGVSAGMVVGAPVAGLFAGVIAFPVAMCFFAVVTLVSLILTVVFIPSMQAERVMSYGKQIAILKKPEVLVSLGAAGCINAAMFGFYSYLAEYLGSAIGLGTLLVNVLLIVYGLGNVIGNVAAGRLLTRIPYAVMIVGPFMLMILYIVLFVTNTLLPVVVVLIVVLGVVVGIVNTTDQFMVSRSAPEAPDFVNGLFLTTTNLGTTIGTSVCGVFIGNSGILFSVLGTVPCLVLGIVFVALRMKCVHEGD